MRKLVLCSFLMLVGSLLAAETPVVTDSAGKEVALKKWKITSGLRKLTWLEGKPEAFEMRELNSTTFKDGIITFVPMSRIASIQYDYAPDKLTMSVNVAGLDQPLTGSTKFKDINAIGIEAEVDQGAAGVVDLRYRGGVIMGGIKGVTFPNAKAPEKPAMPGTMYSFVVPPDSKSKAGPTVQTMHNVQALYRLASGEEKPLSYVMFKKTLKVEVANIQKLSVGEYNVKERTAECELKTKDGSDLSVTLLGTIMIDGKPATLVGLLGDVPAGQRLFPLHTFTELQPGEIKLEEKKEPEPKKVEPKKTPPKKGKE